jgi:hypothetical protein
VPVPPAARTTSVTDSTAREPSASRAWCTITSSALATCSRTAACGSPTPAISASVSRRRSASAGELACTVVSEPSWPVLRACNMSSASGPRTSPTTIRSGRIRSALRTSCLMVTSPRPSRFAGRASRRTTWRWRSRSSAASSIVTIRSSPGMPPESAFSVVVLPEPVPPLTSTDARAATHSARNSASAAGSAPRTTSSRSEKPSRRKRRIVRHGPASDSGEITTFTRDPSGNRASQSGDASSTRRPSGARIRSIACRSSPSPANRTAVGSSRPPRSTYTWSGPFTITSSTAASDSSGSSGPNPRASSTTRSHSAARSASGNGAASRSTSSLTSASSAGPASPDRARSIRRPCNATASSSIASMHEEAASGGCSPPAQVQRSCERVDQ